MNNIFGRTKSSTWCRAITMYLGFAAALALPLQRASAQSNTLPYKVTSVSPEEITISVDPVFEFHDVTDAQTGRKLLRISVQGGSYGNATVGAPGAPVLTLPIIAPSSAPVEVTLTEVQRGTPMSVELAPIPQEHFRNGEAVPTYQVDPSFYQLAPHPSTSVRSGGTFRSTFAQYIEIPLTDFSGSSNPFSLLKHAIVHVRFNATASAVPVRVSMAEQELFASAFINGSVSEYYHSAQESFARSVASVAPRSAYKIVGAAEQWLEVETSQEGVYKISLDDLKAAGISASFDTSSVQLFGAGGAMLPESITPQTGELRECAIEVHGNADGSLKDVYFYAPGVLNWKYFQNDERVSGLWHSLNPYNGTGHYLLKVGGGSSNKRITFQPDAGQPGQPVTTVITATVHQDAKNFEHPNNSRDFIGDRIPIDGSELNITLSTPGISTSDWTYVRPGIDVDGTGDQQHTFSYGVPINLNGAHLGDLSGTHPAELDGANPPIARNWNHGYYLSQTLSAPFSISMSLSSTEQDAHAWLAWVDCIYHRNADLSSGTIPFMVIDTVGAGTSLFRNAGQGEVWDVTNDDAVNQLASADGSGNITVTVLANRGGLRKLIAFTPATASSAHLLKIDAPSLRNTIARTGAEDVIIAPAAFLSQANDLKLLREAGGEATEPLKTIVVSLDDIYREFGYGGHDVTSIRDFLSYMFRYTTAENTSVPMFVTLFGSGHADYQNRITQIPNYVPVYESASSESRTDVSGPQDVRADDCYFGRLTNNAVPDVGVGRLSVQNTDEAAVVVDKLKHYEHGSAQGIWRSIGTFASDDREVAWGFHDPLASDHIADTENEIRETQKRITIKKLYEINYATVITTSGFKKPAAESAVIDAFNSGSVLFSFIGHGNPTVWTHEDLLKVPSTINQFRNYDKLAFVTTATCDFSVYDDYNVHSGGVLLLTVPNGGAVSLLGTSRPVYSGELMVPVFFRTLVGPNCNSKFGSAHIGTALMAGKVSVGPGDYNAISFYIQGDPALRLLVPHQYVVIDSLQSIATDGVSRVTLPALSRVQVGGKISNVCDGSEFDPTFNGNATITLYDAALLVARTSTFTDGASPDIDHFTMTGPILYRGTATVKNGRFSATFVIPKDIEIDTNRVQFNIIAYSDDNRSALGLDTTLSLSAPDPALIGNDTSGPTLAAYLGSRLFRAGDTVATHSLLIVDVHDTNGLNTSTASVGHSFEAWVDDSTSGSMDLASSYLSRQDDYTTGTSTQAVILPAGLHVLHVRAFDAVDNPSVVDLPFVARDASSSSFRIYQVGTFPNPMRDHTTFRFMQPAGEGAPVGVRISLFTTDGRRVRDIEVGTSTSSEIITTWDGRDSQGATLANGAYLYQIVTANINTGATSHFQGRIIIQR